MTGVSGNMGTEALRQTLALDNVAWVRVLLTQKRRNAVLAKKLKKQYGERIDIVNGDIADAQTCAQLVKDADYVVNMAAVIPPCSDADPAASEHCNERGAVALADAVRAMPRRLPPSGKYT